MNKVTTLLLVMFLGGCTVGPDYRRPEVSLPDHFGATTRPATSHVEFARWWTVFGDPQLDSLIDRAMVNNLDLKVAEARVREARAQRGVVAADQWFQVNSNATYRRSRTSENAFSFSGSPSDAAAREGRVLHPARFSRRAQTTDLWQAGFDASWELDLFGGIRRSVEAAEADVSAQVENQRDVLVTLLAEVARNYLELRGFQQQIEIARRNVRIQQDAVEVAQSKARLVGGWELDVARAQAQVASTQSQIPTLETLRDQAAHRLAVLLGHEPRALVAELAEFGRSRRARRRCRRGCRRSCCGGGRTCGGASVSWRQRRRGSGWRPPTCTRSSPSRRRWA